MKTSSDESYALWLVSRKIFTRRRRPEICFDSHTFMRMDTCHLQGQVFIDKYIRAGDEYKNGAFSPKAIAFSDRYLQELQRYTMQDREAIKLDSEFLSKIRKDGYRSEPLLLDRENIQPAAKLLPEHERLNVRNLFETKNLSHHPHSADFVHFRKNQLCIYEKFAFIGNESSIEIHDLDSFLLENPTQTAMRFKIDLKKIRQFCKFSPVLPSADMSDNSSLFINFMKVSEFQGNDILCICLVSGLVLMYDIKSILTKCLLIKSKHGNNPPTMLAVDTRPKQIIRVCRGATAIDVYSSTDNLTYIAIGHDGPAVSVLIYGDKEPGKPICTVELPCQEGVTCVNFTHKSVEDGGDVVLAYSSKCGSLTTINIKYDETLRDLKVHVLDIQFFGDFCGVFVPITKKDFKKTTQFEYLNINYQEKYKRSILYSIIQDSFLLGYNPPLHYSDNFGIGTLTTQIPVPVTPLCRQFEEETIGTTLALEFTSFDGAGAVTALDCEKNIERAKLNQVISGFLCDRVRYDEDSNLKHFYFGNGDNSERFTNLDRQRYENWWNSKIWSTFSWDTLLNSNKVKNVNHFGLKFFSNKSMPPMSSFHSMRILRDADSECSMGYNQQWDKLQAFDTEILFGSVQRTYPDLFGDIKEDLVTSSSDRESSSTPTGPIIISSREFQTTHNFQNIVTSSQGDWSIHNYAKKIKILLRETVPTPMSSIGYQLLELDDTFYFVTYGRSVCLVKAQPLLILSFTNAEIFPVEKLDICSGIDEVIRMSNFDFICHISELNCVVVASELGLISLLRLTEFNGIFSFRQEYILGWERQYPDDSNPKCIECYRNTISDCDFCGIDNVRFPLYGIEGLDYSYVRGCRVEGTESYAVLYIWAHRTLYHFRISGSHYH